MSQRMHSAGGRGVHLRGGAAPRAHDEGLQSFEAGWLKHEIEKVRTPEFRRESEILESQEGLADYPEERIATEF